MGGCLCSRVAPYPTTAISPKKVVKDTSVKDTSVKDSISYHRHHLHMHRVQTDTTKALHSMFDKITPTPLTPPSPSIQPSLIRVTSKRREQDYDDRLRKHSTSVSP